MGGAIKGSSEEPEEEPVQGMKDHLARVMERARESGDTSLFDKVGVPVIGDDAELRPVDDVFDDLLRAGEEMPQRRQEELAPRFFGEGYQER